MLRAASLRCSTRAQSRADLPESRFKLFRAPLTPLVRQFDSPAMACPTATIRTHCSIFGSFEGAYSFHAGGRGRGKLAGPRFLSFWDNTAFIFVDALEASKTRLQVPANLTQVLLP